MSQSTLRDSLPLAGPAGREDHPLDALERSSVESAGAAKGSSDVPVSAPKSFPTSQLTPQGIFRRTSRRPKESYDVLIGAKEASSNSKKIFRRLSRRPKKISDVSVDVTSDLPTSQPAPHGIIRRPSRRRKKSASGRYFEHLYQLNNQL